MRGRTRRTTALESEYLVNLKQAHVDMRDVQPGSDSTETLVNRDPRAWSLIGTASTFRYLVARCSEITLPEGEVMQEPFKPAQLVLLFGHYLDAEEMPDKSDLWSQVEGVIIRMDKPELPPAPLVGSASQTT